jgi:hypothetical protein
VLANLFGQRKVYDNSLQGRELSETCWGSRTHLTLLLPSYYNPPARMELEPLASILTEWLQYQVLANLFGQRKVYDKRIDVYSYTPHPEREREREGESVCV